MKPAYCIISTSRTRTAVNTPSSRTAYSRGYHSRGHSSIQRFSETVSSGSAI